jgi:hypothetical protein
MAMQLDRVAIFRSLETPIPWTAEQLIELVPLIRPIIIWQEWSEFAVLNLTGLRACPPHQRTTLRVINYGAQTNVVVSSRGTSKTATVCNIHANVKGLLHAKKKLVTLSATGFRGGQIVFEDTEKLFNGGWGSQDSDALFMKRSTTGENVIHRGQNLWKIAFDNFTTNITVPTNDPDRIRGIRGHLLFIDEANTIDWELVTTVADAFLNVKDDFEYGGAMAEDNQIFYTSTIDYNWRPFQNAVRAAKEAIARDREAMVALGRGDEETYYALVRQGLHKATYVSFDYSDILIRETLTDREGRRYRVKWPNPKIPLTEDVMGIPFTERDADGKMLQHGEPTRYYQTYPIDKAKLEANLFDGTADTGSWLSEQRNVTDTSTGDVYPHDLVDRATNEGSYYVTAYEHTSEEYKEAFKASKADYTAPVLWQCNDPCVLGVDYARESDFSAFVVIRLGPCATGDYDFMTHHGKTPWCNVVWAEQHAKMTHKQVADKIRELMRRYNLVYHHEPHLTDDWQVCRAIGLDMKGAGNGVRDKLAFIDEDDHDVPPDEFRIYDPADRDDRIAAFATDPSAKPMLDAIWPSAELNDRMVTFTVAQMEQKLLYIGKYVDKTRRTRLERRMDEGFEGVNGLNYQLRRIKSEHGQVWRRFFVEGDTEKATNKKDFWAALLYAAKQARAHIIRQRKIDDTPPPMGAVITRINQGGNRYGRVAGSNDPTNWGNRRRHH